MYMNLTHDCHSLIYPKSCPLLTGVSCAQLISKEG
uniref:Uncharacterized protein n=1 Tax=Escherichia coli TaxID=562 RepID=A0A890DJT4_ECOLX|nr:hypothetical protein [Escherichia coli]